MLPRAHRPKVVQVSPSSRPQADGARICPTPARSIARHRRRWFRILTRASVTSYQANSVENPSIAVL
jgi:hypothetical protein